MGKEIIRIPADSAENPALSGKDLAQRRVAFPANCSEAKRDLCKFIWGPEKWETRYFTGEVTQFVSASATGGPGWKVVWDMRSLVYLSEFVVILILLYMHNL